MKRRGQLCEASSEEKQWQRASESTIWIQISMTDNPQLKNHKALPKVEEL